MARKAGAVASLNDLRDAIRRDFLRACDTLYMIRPRSKMDPETGEERPIDDTEGGLIRFRLFPDQRRAAEVMLDQQRRHLPVRVVKVKPRQSGDSTYGAVWQFHHVYWGSNEHGLTVAHHDLTTQSLYAMTQTLFTELPPELQLQPKKLNRKELAFERPYSNSLVAQTAGFLDIGHGLTINHCHLSEIDLYPDPDVVLEGIMETVAMAAGTSIYIESKAQGVDGWLYQFWNASKRGDTGFHPLFTSWTQVPEYRAPVPKTFEASAEEREWVAEFKITPAQIMWYRAKRMQMIAKEPWGGDRRMKSSYPFTDLEAFQSSGYCVFPDIVLDRLRAGISPPIKAIRLEALPMPGQFNEVKIDVDPRRPGLWIWEDPNPDYFYVLGVDISDGVGETESVVSVLRYPGYKQVAEWFSARSSVEETAYVARYLAERYGGGNCMVIPETNRNGNLILYLLFHLPGNYSVFRWRYLDRPAQEMNDNPKLGWECVSPESKILTADLRWARADELKIGDAIFGCTEKPIGVKGSPLGLRIEHVIERKVFTAPMVSVRLADGRITKVSSNHPFWVMRASQPQGKWIQAAELRRGDLLKCLPIWEPLRSYDAGRLSAFLDGEGHLSQGPRSGVHLLITQAQGPLADEITDLWPALGFDATFKWLRHKKRPQEKPCAVVGLTRLAEVLRALGSLRPTRLLRKFQKTFDISHYSLRSFRSVAVVDVTALGVGSVIGLETSPDHTLIADGIVGHNTNANTKKALVQVANMVFLRGQGEVKSAVLHEQMTRCIDVLPGVRWRSQGGRSDRVIAYLIAVIGAYLDYEGGSVGNMVSERRQNLPSQEILGWREPSTFDAGVDEVYSGRGPAMGSAFTKADMEDR